MTKRFSIASLSSTLRRRIRRREDGREFWNSTALVRIAATVATRSKRISGTLGRASGLPIRSWRRMLFAPVTRSCTRIGTVRAIANNLTVGAGYGGSNGHWLGGAGRGIWSDQIDPKYLALGNLLLQPATSTNIAAANAIIPGVALPFPNFSGSIAQMLRPFPQYTGVSDQWGDTGNSNYHSFQITTSMRASHALSFNFNYTWAKAFDDTGGARTAYNLKIEKARTALPPHAVNLLWVYSSPFDNGGVFGHTSRIVAAIAGHWQISGITTYRDRKSV